MNFKYRFEKLTICILSILIEYLMFNILWFIKISTFILVSPFILFSGKLWNKYFGDNFDKNIINKDIMISPYEIDDENENL